MSKKLWGGRFTKEINKDFFNFQKSISYDYRLAEYDIYHSVVHISALHKAGILNDYEYNKLNAALFAILDEVKEKGNQFILASKIAESAEDIHTYIQNRIEEKLGAKDKSLALKLHSLRSRNDQIVFDEKWYCWDRALDVYNALLKITENIIKLAENNKNQYFIGFTHTQRAQAVSFASYISAYCFMFWRDAERISKYVDSIKIYIGAGALTGSVLTKEDYNNAIEESDIVKKGNKMKLAINGLDNVSDRDFVIELLSIISIIQMHLSRLSEDLILYSTKEFDYIKLPEEFCTGSSLMPHKKNPDFLEMVRGHTGIIYGNLMSILVTMKGLPLTYNRDMQLDKQPLFSSVDIMLSELRLMADFINGIKLNYPIINKQLKKDKTLYATEIAEWLVVKHKVPFKKAHDIAGRLTLLIEKKGGSIKNISNIELKSIHAKLNKAIVKKLMSAKYAVESKETMSKDIPQIDTAKKINMPVDGIKSA